jgi:hypothetical protein
MRKELRNLVFTGLRWGQFCSSDFCVIILNIKGIMQI